MKKMISGITAFIAAASFAVNLDVNLSDSVTAQRIIRDEGNFTILLDDSSSVYTFRWDTDYTYTNMEILSENDSVSVRNIITYSGSAYTTIEYDYDKLCKSGYIEIRAFTDNNEIICVLIGADKDSNSSNPSDVTSTKEPDSIVTTVGSTYISGTSGHTTTAASANTTSVITTTTTTTTAGSTTTVITSAAPSSSGDYEHTPTYPVVTTTPEYSGDVQTETTTFLKHEQFTGFILANDYGDVNSDRIIDLSDLTTLSLYLLNDSELTGSEYYAADVSFDLKVDIADLAKLRQYLSNYNVTLGPKEIIWR